MSKLKPLSERSLKTVSVLLLLFPGIVGKLQQYERDIRARAGGADPATTDG